MHLIICFEIGICGSLKSGMFHDVLEGLNRTGGLCTEWSTPDRHTRELSGYEGHTVLGKKKSPPGFLAITRYHGVGEVPG